MKAHDIKDQESLQAWLENKPVDWAQLIAWRAALRVFPLVLEASRGAPSVPAKNQELALAVWRCLLISSVARKYPTDEMRIAAAAAARAAADAAAATAIAAAAADAAADAARTAARAAGAAAARAGAASATFSATASDNIDRHADVFASPDRSAAWMAIRCDCFVLERENIEGLQMQRLWLEFEQITKNRTEPVLASPVWVEKMMPGFREALIELLGTNAELIFDWYQPLFSGYFNENWSRRFLGKRARTLALRKDDAFWTVSDRREAETIMEDIAAALGWEKRNPWGVDPDEESKSFIFLSHARADRPRATAVRNLLLEQGFDVWWDDDISGGDGWRDRIAERLDKAAVVLTLWSEHSVGRDAVREEAASAQKNRKLVHARLDRADLPYGFGETHYIDMQSWDGTASHEAWRKLAQSLRDKITPAGEDEIRQRLSASSPIAMVAESGMLSPRDTPPNARPTVVNAPDLEQRILALRLTHDRLRSRVDGGHYQVPQDLRFSLDMVASAINAEQLTWYAVDDGY